MNREKITEEKVLHPISGYLMLLAGLLGLAAGIGLAIGGFVLGESAALQLQASSPGSLSLSRLSLYCAD